MRTRPGRIAVVMVTAAFVAGGCVAGGGGSGGKTGPPAPSGGPDGPRRAAPPGPPVPGVPREIARQRLDWAPCGPEDASEGVQQPLPDAECSWLTVPLDYAVPHKSTIKVRVARVRAPAGARRLGSLVFNPGGPGEAGAALVADGTFAATPEVSDRYDLVGFDPRGVHRSAPLICPARDGGSDLIPRTRQSMDAEFKIAAERAADCRKATGALMAHMDTVSVARDLDLLRAALGEDRLDYLGVSYGTYIGQHYARLFPDRVGRFVLDGVVDPGADQAQTAREDVKAISESFASYARTCAANDCSLGGTPDDVTTTTTDFVRGLDAHPVPGPDGARLTTAVAAQAIRDSLYQDAKWPELTQALVDAMNGDPEPLMRLGPYGGRLTGQGPAGETGGPAADPAMARSAIDCLDRPGPRSPDDILGYLGEFEKASPLFGSTVATAMVHCAAWPITPTGKAEPLSAPGAPAMVLVSYAVDPATPLVNARAVRTNLGAGSLVVRAGTGHSAYANGSECTDRAVGTFLVSGKLPPAELDCGA